MKAVINEGCIGCGMCVNTCEEVFRLNDDGFAEVYGEVTADNLDDAKDAESNCPVEVIEVTE